MRQPVTAGHSIGILVKNPNNKKVKVLCHVLRSDNSRIPIQGKNGTYLKYNENCTLCTFAPAIEDKTIILQYLTIKSPIEKGIPLYHSRLEANVVSENISKP